MMRRSRIAPYFLLSLLLGGLGVATLFVSHVAPGATATTTAELGQMLFFDKRLSGDISLSCATCHVPSKVWADEQPLSRGYTNTPYFRNTPTLLNAAQMPFLYWDGRFNGGDLESLVRDHISEAHFMSADGRLVIERLRQVPEYEQMFVATFGGEPSYGKILKALAAFVKGLNSDNHPLASFLNGDLEVFSEQAQSGWALFQGKASCVQCHSGSGLSDGRFYNLGVPGNPDIFQDPLRHITFRRFFRTLGLTEYSTLREDPGRFALTQRDEDWGKFRTPSLLEVAHTGPYMHNGTLETLEEVVQFYDQGGGSQPNKSALLQPLNLTSEEIRDLVAFLGSLKSETFAIEAPTIPPYQSRKLGEN